MQDAEKSEGCASTRACTRKEWEVQMRLCLQRHPRTKISLLICTLQRKGSRWKVREQGPRTFLLDLAEKNGKLIKCSYIKKQNKTKKLRDWK